RRPPGRPRPPRRSTGQTGLNSAAFPADRRGGMAKVQLGTLLVERGLCSPAQIDAAVAEQARTGVSIGRVLVAQGVITETDLVATLAAQVGLEFVDLPERQIDPTAAGSIGDGLARRYHAIPIAWEGS